MSKISELRARIASGEIKPSTGGSSGPKVGEGTFTCLVEGATFEKGNNGNPRGLIKAKVLSGGTDAEVGGTINIYVQTMNQKFAEQSIAEWAGILGVYGITDEKIYDDCDDLQDIIANIMSIANKLGMKGKLKLVIKRKDQNKPDEKGNKRFYNDIVEAVPYVELTAEQQADKELDDAFGKDPVKTEAPVETPVTPVVKPKLWAAK
jgi:hypothetical protein